jgi:hypothetical protein
LVRWADLRLVGGREREKQREGKRKGRRERKEEKNEAPVAEETFFQACLGDWNRAVPVGVAMTIPAVYMDVSCDSPEILYVSRVYISRNVPCSTAEPRSQIQHRAK